MKSKQKSQPTKPAVVTNPLTLREQKSFEEIQRYLPGTKEELQKATGFSSVRMASVLSLLMNRKVIGFSHDVERGRVYRATVSEM